jgi:hypothetical protein
MTRLKALLEERQLQNGLAKIDYDAQMWVHELAEAVAKQPQQPQEARDYRPQEQSTATTSIRVSSLPSRC